MNWEKGVFSWHSLLKYVQRVRYYEIADTYVQVQDDTKNEIYFDLLLSAFFHNCKFLKL